MSDTTCDACGTAADDLVCADCVSITQPVEVSPELLARAGRVPPSLTLVAPTGDPTAEGVAMSDVSLDSTLPATSPTGIPAIPPKAVPYLLGVVSAAAYVAQSYPGTLPGKVAGVIVALAGLLGIASPGLRKPA